MVITVPASFDEVARDLTVEAAAEAGIPNITLLEEPLAAFYSWLDINEKRWDRLVNPGELILICDVGGGTTDFTLITLREKEGNPVFERIAVGDHLILGGDNMDLALAHLSEGRLQGGGKKKLTMGRWQSLCNQCRQAKEDILSEVDDEKTITLIGDGRKLIADTKTSKLNRADVETVILDGFFPLVSPEESLDLKPRQGMTEFGLPYAQDPAITRHLIRFLEQHRQDLLETLDRDSIEPDLIMFNGAALKPAILQERIRAAISSRAFTEPRSPPQRFWPTRIWILPWPWAPPITGGFEKDTAFRWTAAVPEAIIWVFTSQTKPPQMKKAPTMTLKWPSVWWNGACPRERKTNCGTSSFPSWPTSRFGFTCTAPVIAREMRWETSFPWTTP